MSLHSTVLLLCALLLRTACVVCSVAGLQGLQQYQTLQHLQAELGSLSTAQQNIGSFLRSRRISIGLPRGSVSKVAIPSKNTLSRIAVSTDDNLIECRVALGKAPIGAKCVAPCACTGSQKWVQFSELNRLRRKDPDQWTVCRTCQQRFEYELFDQYGSLSANLLGYVLERKGLVRGMLLFGLAGLLSWLSVHMWVARLLTSRVMWMKVGEQPVTISHIFTSILLVLPFLVYSIRNGQGCCTSRYLLSSGPRRWLCSTFGSATSTGRRRRWWRAWRIWRLACWKIACLWGRGKQAGADDGEAVEVVGNVVAPSAQRDQAFHDVTWCGRSTKAFKDKSLHAMDKYITYTHHALKQNLKSPLD